MQVDLGEWLPDQPDFANPGCIEAKNVLPHLRSFIPLRSFVAFSNALNSACLGSYWMPDRNAIVHNFAGDTDSLYKLSGGAWTRVNTASYSDSVSWEFTEFGDFCIAVSPNNDPQVFDTQSSTKFADLSGSPPRAKWIATVRDHVVLGNLQSAPSSVRWSGFNDSTFWGVSQARQADFQELLGRGGKVQTVVPGDYGIIVQEHAICRMDNVGPPLIFQIDQVERQHGTPAPRSVVWERENVYYWSHAGFYRFDGQGPAQPIGANRVDDWFCENADQSSIETMDGVVDRTNRLIMWAFKSSAALTHNDRLIFYSIEADRWAWGELETQFVGERVAPTVTLDDLDSLLPNGIDIDSIPMESDLFKNTLNAYVFNGENKAGLLSGSAVAAVVESREIAMDERAVDNTSVRPLVEGGITTVQLGFRDRLDRSVTYSNATSLTPTGEAPIRQSARYHRYRLHVSDEFRDIQGVEVRSRPGGRR